MERQFNARIEELNQMMAFLESELEKNDCSAKACMQISVAAEEIFVNISHYAYRDCEDSGTMRLSVEREGDAMVLTFTDSGKPFNPLKREDPDVTLSAEDRKIGGLGIYMVKQSMDDVRYQYVNGCNILQLVKSI